MTRPDPTGSSTTAAVPPSSSWPSPKPEMKKSPLEASGKRTGTWAGSAAVITRSKS